MSRKNSSALVKNKTLTGVSELVGALVVGNSYHVNLFVEISGADVTLEIKFLAEEGGVAFGKPEWVVNGDNWVATSAPILLTGNEMVPIKVHGVPVVEVWAMGVGATIEKIDVVQVAL